jgi:hypothetical protein
MHFDAYAADWPFELADGMGDVRGEFPRCTAQWKIAFHDLFVTVERYGGCFRAVVDLRNSSDRRKLNAVPR